MQTRVPPDSARTRTSSRRRRALASCALTIFPAITERSPSGASATVRGVRRSSYRRGRFRSRSPTGRRPFACSFAAMAGPTPRSWMTGVARGSAVLVGAAACSGMLASLPAAPDIGCARAEMSSGIGSSAPSSRMRAASAFWRWASSAESKPRMLAASRSRRAVEPSVAYARACSTTRATRSSRPFRRETPARVANRRGWSSGDSASASAGSPWPATALFLFVDGVLDEQHLEDLVLALAAGGADLHGVAHLAADQATRDRAGDADAAFLQISFCLARDGVLDLLPGIHVLELHRRAEHDPLAGEARDVDDLRPGEAVLQHLDPPFDVRLPFLRGVVLGVLAQVAVISRDGDLVHDARPLDRLQALDLALDGVGAGFGHRDVIACHRLALCE